MPDFTDIKKQLSKVYELEKELHLKQLQINRLLNITQAINNNVSANGLYEMYQVFLKHEIGVRKMALYVRQDDDWSCTTSIGIEEALLETDVCEILPRYTQMANLEGNTHPFIQLFDIVIPVLHKEEPIAYVFIGGFSEDEDMYNKVQFITTITNVVAVAIENKRLFKRQIEQERLKREMLLAGEVQQMLIPKELPITREYEFDHIYKPHLAVGGDYFDFIELGNDKIVFCVGDFTGKGLAAAMLMANFQANFHTLIRRETQLDEFVRDLNASVNLITKGDRFITFFIAEYDVNTRQLRYVNAGHNPPILVTRDELMLLTKGCIMLGSYKEIPVIEIGECEIDKEAIVFSFTDGLTEMRNEEGDMLGEENVNQFVLDNYHLEAVDFNKKLLEFIDQFRGKEGFPDDFTVLTCKLYCPDSRPNFH